MICAALSHWPDQPMESLIFGANVEDFRVWQLLGPLGSFAPYIW